METFNFISLSSLIFFDVLICLTLVVHYRQLHYKFLFFGAIALGFEILRQVASIFWIASAGEQPFQMIATELSTWALAASAFAMMLAVRDTVYRKPFRYVWHFFGFVLLVRIGFNIFLPRDASVLNWYLSYVPAILCLIGTLWYAMKRLTSRHSGGVATIIAVVSLILLRLLIPYVGATGNVLYYGFTYFIESVTFGLACGMLIVTGLEVLHRNYRESKSYRIESEQDLQFLLNNTEDAIISFDDSQLITTWNERAFSLVGYTKKEVLGKKSILDFMVEPDRAVIRRRMRSVADATSFSFRGGVTLIHKSGRLVPVEISARHTEGLDGIATTVIVRDLTLAKAVEEEKELLANRVQHAQKLESLGVLAGGIAHDFNNLLASIMGYSSMALEDSNDPPVKEHLRQVIIASERAAELTDQMLTYSGEGRYRSEKIRLDSVVEEIVQLMRAVISKKASLKFELTEEACWIQGDPAQLSQVVMNLVTNASDSLQESNGSIKVTSGSEELSRENLARLYFGSELKSGKYVYIQVIDSGEGMSLETQQRLFDPFYSTKFTGRGLGMASVAGIVRKHEGAVLIESKLGEGSCFRIYFPAVEPEVEVEQTDIGLDYLENESATILVVEDEHAVRLLARKILGRAGFEVITCEDGLTGLAKYKEISDEVDLVLLDCTLPFISGADLYEKMRQINPNLPVIFCSGYNEDNVAPEAESQWNARFLPKPFKSNDLRMTVLELLSLTRLHADIE